MTSETRQRGPAEVWIEYAPADGRATVPEDVWMVCLGERRLAGYRTQDGADYEADKLRRLLDAIGYADQLAACRQARSEFIVRGPRQHEAMIDTLDAAIARAEGR